MSAHELLGAAVRVLRLPATDRRRTLEAALELARASLEIRVVPSSRTVALLGTPETGTADEPVGAGAQCEAARVGRTVTRVALRLPWHPTCLRQALAVQRMLRRRAIPGRLHLGVTSATEAAAHAWVTVGGRPVVGRQGLERFVPLAAFG